MNAAIPISTLSASKADEYAAHRIEKLPVVVLSPHNRCNCRCVMCDIWKIRETQEITSDDLKHHLNSFRELGVERVVFSGGEALLHSDLATLAALLKAEGIRLTLLTAGLVLWEQAETVAASFDDVIVSLDGPPSVHDRVRRVKGAFARLAGGICALRGFRPEIPISARCTIQKLNCRSLVETVETARQMGLDSISFLGVDAASEAFNRPQTWSQERQLTVVLDKDEVDALDVEVERLIHDRADGEKSFVTESPEKLRRIVHQFRAALGQMEAVSPPCNAPWVSAVIEASGKVRPCFFHPPVGNIHDGVLAEIVNGPRALAFRQSLDVASNPICRRCVCSLYRPVTPIGKDARP